jgi:hypothetical protein
MRRHLSARLIAANERTPFKPLSTKSKVMGRERVSAFGRDQQASEEFTDIDYLQYKSVATTGSHLY